VKIVSGRQDSVGPDGDSVIVVQRLAKVWDQDQKQRAVVGCDE
jgi:hypothetical protein